MTIAKKSDLEKYIKGTNGDIDFHFVVPKSIFSDYKKQHLHTAKGTVLRNKSSWLDRFKQYVIDFAVGQLVYTSKIAKRRFAKYFMSPLACHDDVEVTEGYTAQALVNKEVRKQLPDTVSDDALGKKKEMKAESPDTRFLRISMNADFEVAYSSGLDVRISYSCLLLVVDDLDVETDNDELEVDNEEIDL
ncbi:hypothetical protein RhiirA4_468400 [Rhizophagus irregularis]|uniref:Uncharacterized protein n=1 Tax=Rhizophagus irregularis TaxID=588596 RepID=A0A2I1GXM1_9GLOM|nr:hypothetical protein RhiirA4_468400 [Rhizophagus irregularis]